MIARSCQCGFCVQEAMSQLLKGGIHYVKKVLCLIVSGVLIFSCTLPAFAAEADPTTRLNVYRQECRLPSNQASYFSTDEEDTATTYSDSVIRFRHEYEAIDTLPGAWRNGASGGSDIAEVTVTLDRSDDTTYNIDFTASVSGQYSRGSSIETTLGVSLGKSKSYSLGAGASVTVPIGEHYMIKYRSIYVKYKVTETMYRQEYVLGFGFVETDLLTQICYVDVFSHWDFTVVDD